MTNEKDLGKELLKQNGIEPDRLSQVDRSEMARMLAKENARVRRMKWATIISWALTIISFILYHVLARMQESFNASYGAILPMIFFYIAVVCSVSLYIRSRLASTHRIHARLANIEEQLKRLAENK